MLPLRWIGATFLMAVPAAAQDANPHFEVDIIFPRNETYTVSDAFPFALAIQNITAMRSPGEWYIHWIIMPLEDGINKRPAVFSGAIAKGKDEDMGDYTVLTDYTDVTQWIEEKQLGDIYALKWFLDWPDLSDECGWVASPVQGEIQFSIETPREQEKSGLGIQPDVASAGKCPVLSSLVEIRPKPANETCDIVSGEESGMEGTPCEVVVDAELAESITSKVVDLIGPTVVPGDFPGDDEEEDDAGSPRPSVGSASVIACALGCIAFVFF